MWSKYFPKYRFNRVDLALESTNVVRFFISYWLTCDLRCVFCAAHLANPSHTDIPPPRVALCAVNRSPAVPVEEVFSSWNAVQLTGVLSCHTHEIYIRINVSSLHSIYDFTNSRIFLCFFASDLRNMGATCSVVPGSWSHRTGSTAPHGNPWIPPDSPEVIKGRPKDKKFKTKSNSLESQKFLHMVL